MVYCDVFNKRAQYAELCYIAVHRLYSIVLQGIVMQCIILYCMKNKHTCITFSFLLLHYILLRMPCIFGLSF